MRQALLRRHVRRPGSPRVALATLTAAIVLAASLLLGVTNPAAAQGEPGDVQVRPAGNGQVVVIVPVPGGLPPLDARTQFRYDGAVLGDALEYPGRLQATLPLPQGVTPDQLAAGLEVWVGGRPLDEVTVDVVPGGSTAPAVVPSEPDRTEPAPEQQLAATDPAARGPFATARTSYDRAPFRVPDMAVPLEVVADVIHPTNAPGRRPLVLFLHGRHTTCYDPLDLGALLLEWPCPEGTLPIPSHEGYRDTADLLASQGFITVSISANGINAQDGFLEDAGMAARSALVRHHLDLLRRWSRGGADPMAAVLRNRVDWNRVILVGHSRGGEGVVRAAVDALAQSAPYRITGLSLIGPTNFQRRVAPGVHTSVIHPYCDGDVSDLQGQLFVDNARDLLSPGTDRGLYSAAMVLGANHNYFNIEWTPGEAVAPAWDDWFGPAGTCSAQSQGRLTPAEQRAAGAVYIAALARLAGYDDQSAVPFLDGSAVRAPSAGRARVLTHAVGGEEQVLYRAGDPGRVATSPAATATVCSASVPSDQPPAPGARCFLQISQRAPHWLPMFGLDTEPGVQALRVRFDDGASVAFPVGAPDLSAADHLDVRLAPDGVRGDLQPVLALTLTDGTQVGLPAVARFLPRLPASDGSDQFGLLPKVWAQTVRFDLSGIDPARRSAVSRMALVFRGASGTGFVLDVTARKKTVSQAQWRTDLPRIDVEARRVTEGDGPRRVSAALVLSRPAVAPVQLWVQTGDPTTGMSSGRAVTVPAGQRRVSIPVTIPGDDVFTGTRLVPIAVRARSNATVGAATGGLIIIDDEPAPVVTITPTNADIAEGETATWTINLSEPVGTDTFFGGWFVTPDSGPELTIGDLSDRQRAEWFLEGAPLDLTLSESVFVVVVIPAGETTAAITMEVAVDGIVEPTEYARLVLDNSLELQAPPRVVTASVRD